MYYEGDCYHVCAMPLTIDDLDQANYFGTDSDRDAIYNYWKTQMTAKGYDMTDLPTDSDQFDADAEAALQFAVDTVGPHTVRVMADPIEAVVNSALQSAGLDWVPAEVLTDDLHSYSRAVPLWRIVLDMTVKRIQSQPRPQAPANADPYQHMADFVHQNFEMASRKYREF